MQAQVLSPGTTAPGLEVHESFNGDIRSWDDLAGKAILVKFSRTW